MQLLNDLQNYSLTLQTCTSNSKCFEKKEMPLISVLQLTVKKAKKRKLNI